MYNSSECTLEDRNSPGIRRQGCYPATNRERVDMWGIPVMVTPNNFIHKSLSNWSVNFAVGCSHACRFCYVPSAATIKQGPKLRSFGVTDPDAEWGEYVLLRPFNERHFMNSLSRAEVTPVHELKPDGNRAVMLCSTTDAYQVIRHPNPVRRRELGAHLRQVTRRVLELIRDHSTLRVRILTRSPLAKADFELFKTFGNRLLFGMSLPTLRNDLSKVYEPKAPSPLQRLDALRAAKQFGLNVYVAMAPTYPECDESDLRATLEAIRELDPVTIFHEPINIRAENVARIARHAHRQGVALRTEVFDDRCAWECYALHALRTVETLAGELGVNARLHPWPDKSLGAKCVVCRQDHPEYYRGWLQNHWSRVSDWPGKLGS